MKISDFILDKIDRSNGHEDYWFYTTGETSEELCKKYMEQGMQTAYFDIVYSKDEDIVGIKRQFLFNYDVVVVDDENLKSILRELTKGE